MTKQNKQGKKHCEAQQQSGYWKGYPCGNDALKGQDYCAVHYGVDFDNRLYKFEKINGRWKKVKL